MLFDGSIVISGTPTGVKFVSCTPVFSTYKISGTSASVDTMLTLERLSDQATRTTDLQLKFTQTNTTWQISDFTINNTGAASN